MFPDIARFRRFRAQWAKLIHDDTQEVLLNQYELHKALKQHVKHTSKRFDVLDIPRKFVYETFPEVIPKWEKYEESLRQQGNAPL